jgi:hypothetical protein
MYETGKAQIRVCSIVFDGVIFFKEKKRKARQNQPTAMGIQGLHSLVADVAVPTHLVRCLCFFCDSSCHACSYLEVR